MPRSRDNSLPDYLWVGQSGDHGYTTEFPNGETYVDLDGQKFGPFATPEEADDFIEQYENGEAW